MASQLDNFMREGVTQTNYVMGTESITLTGGITLSGVWTSVMTGGESAFGGEMLMASTALIVPAAANVTRNLKGKRGTYNGMSLRVERVDVGNVESTIYFTDETESLKL
jgi:hypothetical protein